jgi:hypothetical protein
MRIGSMKAFLLVLTLSASLRAADVAPFPKAWVQSAWVQTIWSDGTHNGFPGIARVGDYYYVTFRNAESHQADHAKIVVIRAEAKDLKQWQKVAEFTRDHDCRDPLVFDNHGKAQSSSTRRRITIRNRRTA